MGDEPLDQREAVAYPPRRRETREVLALRAWNLVRWSPDGAYRLASVSQGDVWHEPVFHADVRPDATTQLGAGVYAIKSGSQPRREFNWVCGSGTWIWGWVGLYGQVIEHENGYRAEHAVVRRLRLGVQAHLHCERWPDVRRLVEQLESRYQCRVKVGQLEYREAVRMLSYRDMGDERRFYRLTLQTLSPPVPPLRYDIPPQAAANLPVAIPGTGWYPGQAKPRARRPKPAPGFTKDGLKIEAVANAFRRAERELPGKYARYAKDLGRLVTLTATYSRIVAPAVKCYAEVRLGGPASSRLFPKAVVRLAARILRVKMSLLVSREWKT